MKKIIIAIVICVMLVGCSTSESILTRPNRPTLEEVSENVPIEAQRNILALMVYAQRLETLVDEYERMVR